ncbi:MAG TPA: DUF4097 family beta strand repeat-containing protein [Pyrinomonadaceae bacterium]|jgi:hypothetical protein
MKNRLMVLLIVLAMTAVSVERLSLFETRAGSAPAASQDKEFRWNGRVAAGRTIEIKNINGNIHAEPSSGGEVEVVANKQGRRSNPDEVQIKVIEHEGGVTICSVYPSPDRNQPNDCRPGKDWSSHTRDNDVSVDYTLRVPQGVRLSAKTVNGEVGTGLIQSDVEAFSVNGSIRVAATGYVEAKTVNGSINASFGSANWSGSLDFKTVNGEIVLDLPADTSTDVHAETLNGDIVTDFPLTVQGRISRRRLNGTIGSGGRALELKTINGSIRLRRAS